MTWKVDFTAEGAEDLESLDGSVRPQILGAINKIAQNPLGYGEPLGNKIGINLTGLRSARAGSFRVVYWVFPQDDLVAVVAIAKREKFAVHRIAHQRIKRYRELATQEITRLGHLIDVISQGVEKQAAQNEPAEPLPGRRRGSERGRRVRQGPPR